MYNICETCKTTIKIWVKEREIKMVHFNNPCNSLSVESLEELAGYLDGKVILRCGDFNAHCTLWGSSNENGMVTEGLMENKNLVCVNDGRGTRVDSRTGAELAIDLALMSDPFAGIRTWDLIKVTSIGSDHYPIMIEVGLNLEQRGTGKAQRWSFSSADWEKFRTISDKEIEKIDNVDILKGYIFEAAKQSVKVKAVGQRKKIVP